MPKNGGLKMKKEGCPYCNGGEALAKFGVLAFKTEVSQVIVFKDQSHKGRCIVAYDLDHKGEICELDEENRAKFLADVNDVAVALHKAYKPARLNYGAYGDTLGHLHFHLVPKYENGFEWGGTFQMNTGNYASDSDIEEVVKTLKANFRK